MPERYDEDEDAHRADFLHCSYSWGSVTFRLVSTRGPQNASLILTFECGTGEISVLFIAMICWPNGLRMSGAA